MPHTATRSPLTTSQLSGQTDRLSAAPDILFAYGTLRFRDVIGALLGRAPAALPQTIRNWRAAALRDRPYPGLIPSTGTTTGELLTDLGPDEWRVIDAFEDEHYRLERLPLDGGGHAWAYVWERDGDVLPEAWDPEHFAQTHLSRYVERCARWRDAYERRQQAGDRA